MEKNVLITGASRGIGRETAFQFASAGYNVGICYHKNKNGAEEVAKKCLKIGSKKVLTMRLDLKKDDSIKKTINKFVEQFGRIDILINNAGILYEKPILEHEFEELQNVFDVNIIGLMKITKEAVKNMEKGVIVNVASTAAYEVYKHIIPYCATKFAVRAYTKGLASELPKGINVFGVNPGLTATKMSGFKGIHPSVVARVIFKTALGKYKKKSGKDVDVHQYSKILRLRQLVS